MNTEFFNALDALEQERGISKAHMITKIETALKNAYEKEKNGLQNVKVVIDEAKKEIKVYQTKRVVALVENEATVKTFFRENGHYRLQPENETMEPIIVTEVDILGKVVAIQRSYI